MLNGLQDTLGQRGGAAHGADHGNNGHMVPSFALLFPLYQRTCPEIGTFLFSKKSLRRGTFSAAPLRSAIFQGKPVFVPFLPLFPLDTRPVLW